MGSANLKKMQPAYNFKRYSPKSKTRIGSITLASNQLNYN